MQIVNNTYKMANIMNNSKMRKYETNTSPMTVQYPTDYKDIKERILVEI
jgi:hypothetical protein